MELVELTLPHWYFLLIVFAIFVSIGFRKGVIIPSIVGIFGLGFMSGLENGLGLFRTFIHSVQIVFAALLNSGVELFDIMLVIALMVAMLNSLKSQGADLIMVAPMQKLMVGPKTAFLVLAVTMYLAAAFFWPTPAVALVGTVLIPVAMKVGLPATAAAVAVNLAGHGMALSADPVIQGATNLTASAANIDPAELLPYTILFSFTTGGVAIILASYTIWRDMRKGILVPTTVDVSAGSVDDTLIPDDPIEQGRWARHFAIGVPVTLLSIVLLMIYQGIFDPENAIRGGAATALLGGAATVLLVFSTVATNGIASLDKIAEHTRHGFFFTSKIFAPIIPIAGFFFLGNPDHAAAVLGQGTPGYLFDIGSNINQYMDANKYAQAMGVTITGMLTGMDGSGFSGLPLVGSLTGALIPGGGTDTAILAALGQVVTIFTGGGTLVAWAFGVCADAGIAGIDPASLVRRNFFPVITGMIVTTFLAINLMS